MDVCMRKTMSKYVDSTEQLVTEILVKNIKDSTRFYSLLGFQLLRDGGDFVEFTWEDHRLFLAEISAFHERPSVNFAATSGISCGKHQDNGSQC
jgi:catechol 2,3-dioxygenase-like lactoylglutathione lyase family enzyme